MDPAGEWIVQVVKPGQSPEDFVATYGPTKRYIIRRYLRRNSYDPCLIYSGDEKWVKAVSGKAVSTAYIRPVTQIKYIRRSKRTRR